MPPGYHRQVEEMGTLTKTLGYMRQALAPRQVGRTDGSRYTTDNRDCLDDGRRGIRS